MMPSIVFQYQPHLYLFFYIISVSAPFIFITLYTFNFFLPEILHTSGKTLKSLLAPLCHGLKCREEAFTNLSLAEEEFIGVEQNCPALAQPEATCSAGVEPLGHAPHETHAVGDGL